MSKISVNSIEPRTAAAVNITGLQVPTYQGQDLALKQEVLLKSGGVMTGSFAVQGNATQNLEAVPLQQMAAFVPTQIETFFQDRVLAVNGYQELPGGLLLQWGTLTIPGSGNAVTGSFTFPVVFPNAVFNIQATPARIANGGWSAITVAVTARSLTGGTVVGDSTDPGVTIDPNLPINWFAIGY